MVDHSFCLLGLGSALIQGYGAIDALGGLFLA